MYEKKMNLKTQQQLKVSFCLVCCLSSSSRQLNRNKKKIDLVSFLKSKYLVGGNRMDFPGPWQQAQLEEKIHFEQEVYDTTYT